MDKSERGRKAAAKYYLKHKSKILGKARLKRKTTPFTAEQKVDRNRHRRNWYNRNKKKLLAKAATPKALKKARKYAKSFRDKHRYDRDENGNVLYSLYYLKEDHYGGITKQVKLRMIAHRAKGRHVDDVEIVFQSPHLSVIVGMERVLHSFDYGGRHPYRNRYERWEVLRKLREDIDKIYTPF